MTSCPDGHNKQRHRQFLNCSGQDKSWCILPSKPYCLGENYAAGGGNVTVSFKEL